MISFTVGTTFLTHWLLGQRGNDADTRLRHALEALQGEKYLSVKGEDELRSHCVYEILDAFFQKLRPILINQLPGDLTTLTAELQRTGSDVYSHPSFIATQEHAVGWLAIHQLHPHGQVMSPGSSEKTNVFLPEFANRLELFCFFSGFGCPSIKDGAGDETILDLFEERVFQNKRADLRAHLCDTLHSVYSRVRNAAKGLQDDYASAGRTDGRRFQPNPGEEQLLILDAHVGGFRAYRSLRRDFASIPPLGGHRLLVASAIRQGLGMPVISETFPHELWTPLPNPVKHFVLTAAEAVGRSRCEPLYPDVPTKKALNALDKEVTCGFIDNMNPDDPRHAPTLKMLGLGQALSMRKAEFRDRRHAGDYDNDWNDVGEELVTAIYGDDIERSLHLQGVLDLYPLHKRVLGLVEYIILPRLKAKGVGGEASSAWSWAFTGKIDDDTGKQTRRGLSTVQWPDWPDKLATLETEGNWILHAADHENAQPTAPVDLAGLLDGIMTRMASAEELAGVSVNLQRKPHAHALQLGALADRNEKAACMTLYLGKIALMLRNAIEHGADEVVGAELLVKTPGYWKVLRGYKGKGEQGRYAKPKRIPIFEWHGKTASGVAWRSRDLLPKNEHLPTAANEFLLTPASLHRCLVLMSLVLHGAFSHLDL